MASFDVASLFTNVSLNETLLVNKAFASDWLNQTLRLNLQKDELDRLLDIATSYQLFQFNGQVYEQVDGVAMGSPVDPLIPPLSNLSKSFHPVYEKDKWKTAVSCELVSLSRCKHQLKQLKGKCVIPVTRLALQPTTSIY